MTVRDFRDSDGQVADKEREEDGQHHLRYPPLVAACLGFPRILDGGPLVGAVVEAPGDVVLRALMFAHPLLRTVEEIRIFSLFS